MHEVDNITFPNPGYKFQNSFFFFQAIKLSENFNPVSSLNLKSKPELFVGKD
jgi:hypothetical protein